MSVPKNLTFHEPVVELAEELMKLRGFDNLSGFLSQLVREEHERRRGPVTFQDKPAPSHASAPATTPRVTYPKHRRKLPKG
jgi:hypothetical protein